ncbi:hypothetical protein B9031_015975 [Klebsiella aerogenes]|nr:hypothetical protein B9031_015975 [Klebsiella aerogenes]
MVYRPGRRAAGRRQITSSYANAASPGNAGWRCAYPAYNSKSPVALPLTGATALCDLVARTRRNAPPPTPARRRSRQTPAAQGAAWRLPPVSRSTAPNA